MTSSKKNNLRAVYIGLAVVASVFVGVAIIVVAVKISGRKETNAQTQPKIVRPNIIVMQPDDFPFFAEWTAPPANPRSFVDRQNFAENFPKGFSMPNIERLRKNGVQMTQAYAASPACATSRFSTITGRYPTRSGNSRWYNMYEKGPSFVTIPSTLLVDVEGYSNDCTKNNIAVTLKGHGYRTGVVGKWHLSPSAVGSPNQFATGRGGGGNEGGRGGGPETYSDLQKEIRGCGFDYAEGLYRDNLPRGPVFTPFSHNHEWVTAKAIDFINSEEDSDKPFFLYFNPTVPHPNGHVETALTYYPCTQTPAGTLYEEPVVPTMTEGIGCHLYRQTIFDRAGEARSNHELGAIWIDDSVGALINTLNETGKLDNTIFLFQLDHGVEAKMTHWENGIRIPQFIHYPREFGTDGLKISKPVSTIDVTPTLLDFAGVSKDDLYKMDGESWRKFPARKVADKIGGEEDDDSDIRCLLSEWEMDRSLICGRCHKLMYFDANKRGDFGSGRTEYRGREAGYDVGNNLMYFNLCDEEGNYVNYPNESTETVNSAWEHWDIFQAMEKVLNCLLQKTSPQKPLDFDVESCSFSDALEEFRDQTGPPEKSPTFSPTASPTLSNKPSTSPGPTLEGDCKNQKQPFVVEGGRFHGMTLDCDWVYQQPGVAACNQFGHICPLACGECERNVEDGCVDEIGSWNVTDGGMYNGLEVNCTWVSERKGQVACDRYGDKCPNSCNLCCRDTTDTWIAVGGKFDGVELNCTWVSERQGVVACNLYSDKCPKACNICT